MALFALGIVGTLFALAGGYIRSSSYDKCVDGPEIHECSGTFASEAWHGMGLGFVIAGLALVVVALAMAALARPKPHEREMGQTQDRVT